MDLWAVLLGGVLTLGGVLVTGVVAYLTARLQVRSALNLDSARRADDRQVERERFDRANLIELQDSVGQLLIDLGHVHIAQNGSTEAKNAAGASYASTGLRVQTLASRAGDEQTRALALALVEAGRASYRAQSGSEADTNAILAAGNLVDHLGPLIAKTFRGT